MRFKSNTFVIFKLIEYNNNKKPQTTRGEEYQFHKVETLFQKDSFDNMDIFWVHTHFHKEFVYLIITPYKCKRMAVLFLQL